MCIRDRKSERPSVRFFKRRLSHFRPLRDPVRVEKRVSLGRFKERNQIVFQLADDSASLRRRGIFGRERYFDDHAPRRELEERVWESWVDRENDRRVGLKNDDDDDNNNNNNNENNNNTATTVQHIHNISNTFLSAIKYNYIHTGIQKNHHSLYLRIFIILSSTSSSSSYLLL